MGASTSSKKGSASSTLLQDLLGLLFLFLAAFTLLSLCSYSNQDPSFFTSSRATAKNLAGIFGSHWASLLWQVLGAAAFMQATIFLLAGIALFRRISRQTWALAAANYILLLIATAACLGLVRSPIHFGGSRFSPGGMVGELLGGFFQSYLNTAGAALLTGCIFLFAVSLSTKVSVRDLGLYVWLGISKTALRIVGVLLYGGMHVWAGAAHAYSGFRPQLGKSSSALWEKTAAAIAAWREARALKAAQRAEAKKNAPKIETPVVATEPTIEKLAPVIPLRPQMAVAPMGHEPEPGASTPLMTHESSDEGPEIIFDQGEGSQELFDSPGEMATPKGEKSTFSPLMNFVKKAAHENERAVKTALGKKIKYELPPTSFLHTPIQEENKLDREELLRNSKMLEEKLADFNVKGQVTAVKPGPVVTMYEFKPAAGVKVNSISNLADDLALALSAKSIRIVAPIPGRDVVGIEVPNKNRESVMLKEIIAADTFHSRNHSIPVAVGKDILGAPVVADLKKMPHLLVAGTTGSGKSVFVNPMLCSFLSKFSPQELNLILVDPKQLELAPYNDIPHLLLPVVTEPKKASLALNWAVQEMERRYRVIAASVTRDQEGYNKKLEEVGEEKMHQLINKGRTEIDEKYSAERMPKLVIVIDELADLMMTAKSDVENNICRLAQKARAAGIHLVLATQRPSTDVVTGLIKANLPSRICFKVSSKVDSRVMFDAMGAEKLIGMGDMLFMPPGDSALVRMHGAYISVEEVDQITSFWRSQGKPTYRDDILVDPEEAMDGEGAFSNEEANDPLYLQALEIAHSSGAISASYLQRRLRIGYNKAARFVEMMEAQGVVGPADGSKPRPVLGHSGPRT